MGYPYPPSSLVRIADPAATPVSVSDCKAHLRILHSDEDALITGLLNAAVAYVDGHGVLGRAMVTQTWRQTVGQNPGTVRLQMAPFQSLAAVKYFDTSGVEQTATLSDFDVFGGADSTTVSPKPGFSWPTAQDRPDAIAIEYVAGDGDAGDVSAGIKQAILMLVAHWYEHRETAVEKSQSEVPFGFKELLNVERTRWYG